MNFKIASIQISFKFTPNYPDELPEIIIDEIENYDDEEGMMQFMRDTGEENLGMPMIYTIASAVLEKLNKDNEERRKFEEAERDRIATEKEEEEIRRYEGNKVTVEVFLKWKMAFDKEMAELKKQSQGVGSKKPTGKQLFETNESLFKDLADEGVVEVDETLFQNLDDLDLDDDDDDEWQPDNDETDEE